MSSTTDTTDTNEPPAGSPGAALDQIRVYLLKEGTDIDSAVRGRDDRPLERFEINTGDLIGTLFVDAPPTRRPDWLPFLEDVAGRDIEHTGNRHVSAVLLLTRRGRTFALSFGFGRHLLRPDALEPEYGLRTAAGLVDPDRLAAVDSRAFEATVLQVRRQSSSGTGTRGIGFDLEREMLRALAGEPLDESLGTRITGSDSVGLTAKLGAGQLGARIDALHDAYVGRRYRTSFDYLDRWRQLRASEPVRAELDTALVARLEKMRELIRAGASTEHLPGGQGLVLAAPQIIEYSASGFLANVEPAGTSPHPFPDLDAYLRSTRRPPTIDDLRSNHDLLLNAGEPFVVEHIWPIYSALVWEVVLDGQTYILSEGTWWQVDGQYLATLDGRLARIPEAELTPFDPLEDEEDYNIRLASEGGTRAVLDRRLAYFEDEQGGVEPCDVLTEDREFIHVKRMTGSAAMSHLFGQSLVAARLFVSSDRFRDHLRGQLPASSSLRTLVPEGRPDSGEFKVVLGIIRRGDNDGHIALDLPFFSRNFLSFIATQIETIGYEFQIARIPVVVDARPASAGPVLRLQEDVDPRPNRWGARSRRRRRPAAPVTLPASQESVGDAP